MTARSYNNTSRPISLAAGVNSSVGTLTFVSTSGYPTPPFTGAIDRGTDDEEFFLCTAMDATSMTVTRGYDGTTGVAHDINAPVEHCVGAIDYAEANAHINNTGLDHHTQYLLRSVLTTKGDLFARTTSGITRLGVGVDGQVLTVDAAQTTGVKWSTIQAVPTGVMFLWAGNAAPTGYLLMTGQTVSRTTYADLFAIVGTDYNTGGEAGTDFRLPDARGRVFIGAGTGSGLTNRVRATKGGFETHTLSAAEMPVHTHTQNAHTHTQNSHDHDADADFVFVTGAPTHEIPVGDGSGGGLPVAASANTTNAATATNQNATAVNQNAGSGGAHANMQPWLATNVIIKT